MVHKGTQWEPLRVRDGCPLPVRFGCRLGPLFWPVSFRGEILGDGGVALLQNSCRARLEAGEGGEDGVFREHRLYHLYQQAQP